MSFSSSGHVRCCVFSFRTSFVLLKSGIVPLSVTEDSLSASSASILEGIVGLSEQEACLLAIDAVYETVHNPESTANTEIIDDVVINDDDDIFCGDCLREEVLLLVGEIR